MEIWLQECPTAVRKFARALSASSISIFCGTLWRFLLEMLGTIERGIAGINLFHATGLAASVGEARRLVRGGGARFNDKVVSDEKLVVRARDLNSDGVVKLSAGRKRHALVRVG